MFRVPKLQPGGRSRLQTQVDYANSIPVTATGFPEHMPSGLRQSCPDTLTVITTYQCNAACAECCFECNPAVRDRLSLASITGCIDRAAAAFPGLELVAFSGGECFLLKQDLYAAIAHAHGHSLRTRCVTNGFWGNTPAICDRTVQQLVDAGIDEINISTGRDHQEWVPVDSVIRAAQTLVARSVFTLVTVEMDTPESRCLQRLTEQPEIRRLMQNPALFRLQCNSWMPFHADSAIRRELSDKSELRSGCTQLFHNVTLTPKDELAACCGLTMEHIPEMKLGSSRTPVSMAGLYYRQFEDFLKIWIHVDG
ncbi:MAG: radical SAM protein, partial [Gammaproteobacteria bacterium]